MSISNTDIAKLWGLAGGCCNAPGCQQDCIPFLDPKTPTVIGEMAHIIAKSKDGPRGDGVNDGNDSYENRILLCPTCHTKVDKAADKYPPEVLFQWKLEREAFIQASRKTPRFGNIGEIAQAIERLLQANHYVWKQFSSDSELAKNNPYRLRRSILGISETFNDYSKQQSDHSIARHP